MNEPPRTRRRVVAASPRRPPPELCAVRAIVFEDPNPDTSYLDQDEFADRKAEYERGDFGFVVVRVEAEVRIEGIQQTLTSRGLYGIESDSDEEELVDLAAEEWSQLRNVLKAVGIPTSNLPLEVDPEWLEWRT